MLHTAELNRRLLLPALQLRRYFFHNGHRPRNVTFHRLQFLIGILPDQRREPLLQGAEHTPKKFACLRFIRYDQYLPAVVLIRFFIKGEIRKMDWVYGYKA